MAWLSRLGSGSYEVVRREDARRLRSAHFWGQVLLLGSFELVYALSGVYGRAHASAAVGHAREVIRLERTLGIAWEHGIQRWALAGPHLAVEVANRVYFLSQFTVSTGFLIWVYLRRAESFTRVRNALLAANAVQVVVLFAYPTAPPRMVAGAGYVDTMRGAAVSLQSSVIDALNNPYSAMPSLHASYAFVIGIAGVMLARRVWVRCVWAVYPLVVTYSVIASGNHFVLDVVAGVLALSAAPLVDRWAGALARRRERRSSLGVVVGAESVGDAR